MNNLVIVYNLATKDEYTFMGCPPSEAVIRAWLMEHGKCNTWEWAREYAERYAGLIWGRRSVAYGDYAAAT